MQCKKKHQICKYKHNKHIELCRTYLFNNYGILNMYGVELNFIIKLNIIEFIQIINN